MEVVSDPDCVQAKRRPEIHANARTFHLTRPGQQARQFLLFRVTDEGIVEVGRLLYDGMDLPQHLPPGFEA